MSVVDLTVIQRAIVDWIENSSGLARDKIAWMDEQGDRPVPPFVGLSIEGERSIGHDWKTKSHNPLLIPDLVVTANATTNRLMSVVPHQLQTGDGPVTIASTVSLPTGLVDGQDYWLIVASSSEVLMAESLEDAMDNIAIDLVDSGTGVLTLADTPDTVRVGREISLTANGMRTATLLVEAFGDKRRHGMSIARAILDSLAVHETALDEGGVGIGVVGPLNNTSTGRGGILEPRGRFELSIHYASESSTAYLGRIDRVELEVVEDSIGIVASTTIPT